MGASTKLRTTVRRWWRPGAALSLGLLAVTAGVPRLAGAAVVLPDPNVCDGVLACEAASEVCQAGFEVTFEGYQPASTSSAGAATFTYLVCSPPAGVCSLDATRACLDDDACARQDAGVCQRSCAVPTFRGLSHYDVNLPEFGGTCLSTTNEVTGSCTAIDNTPLDGHTASVGRFLLGDGSCSPDDTSIAKCDATELAPGDCLRMTVSIAGETHGLGAGAAVVYDKAANVCTASCLSGPSCEPCDDPGGDPCLTRTIGFWGTHPWITNDYAPVQVCGVTLGCNGASDGITSPSCGFGACTDVMEALGSVGGELKSNAPYVALVRQLAAAKLNLAASASFDGGTACTDVTIEGELAADLVARCEALCGANKATITESRCIERLDAFNNLPDLGFEVTPPPFDRPSIDDLGSVSGADPRAYTAAGGSRVVIGKASCNQAP